MIDVVHHYVEWQSFQREFVMVENAIVIPCRQEKFVMEVVVKKFARIVKKLSY
jgi:hypothetical protein